MWAMSGIPGPCGGMSYVAETALAVREMVNSAPRMKLRSHLFALCK